MYKHLKQDTMDEYKDDTLLLAGNVTYVYKDDTLLLTGSRSQW